jgi:hypothetical protein
MLQLAPLRGARIVGSGAAAAAFAKTPARTPLGQKEKPKNFKVRLYFLLTYPEVNEINSLFIQEEVYPQLLLQTCLCCQKKNQIW